MRRCYTLHHPRRCSSDEWPWVQFLSRLPSVAAHTTGIRSEDARRDNKVGVEPSSPYVPWQLLPRTAPAGGQGGVDRERRIRRLGAFDEGMDVWRVILGHQSFLDPIGTKENCERYKPCRIAGQSRHQGGKLSGTVSFGGGFMRGSRSRRGFRDRGAPSAPMSGWSHSRHRLGLDVWRDFLHPIRPSLPGRGFLRATHRGADRVRQTSWFLGKSRNLSPEPMVDSPSKRAA